MTKDFIEKLKTKEAKKILSEDLGFISPALQGLGWGIVCGLFGIFNVILAVNKTIESTGDRNSDARLLLFICSACFALIFGYGFLLQIIPIGVILEIAVVSNIACYLFGVVRRSEKRKVESEDE